MDSMAPAAINVSIGTAAVLGLARVPMAVAPTTAYLMLGGRCQMSCAFCAQARDSKASALNLSRVTWPEYPLDSVVERLAQAAADRAIRRACLQVTVTAVAFAQALAVVRTVKTASAIPFDVAFLPHGIDQVRQIVEAGADHVGFGLDAACERVFRPVKGGNWAHSLTLIEEVARAFPGHAALHLIVGLGETEQEMVERIQWAQDLGATTGLFAFTPLRGTPLAGWPPPPLAVYRRMQAARWLIAHGLARVEGMAFDPQGRLLDLGAPLPASGEPFQTSGCPDCNRPFYNEQPGGVLYNYPRPLTAKETAQAVQAMEL
ncbi:MAG: radical SAM protein [Anaerolineae bacterium]|nr:radical SAM protein [Anaerolineae bacterium]